MPPLCELGPRCESEEEGVERGALNAGRTGERVPLVSGGTISSSSAVIFEPNLKATFPGYPPIRIVLCRGIRSPGGGQPSDTKPRGGGPPHLGSKRIVFLTNPLRKRIMVDERGSDRCPPRPSDVESPSLLGSSEDHKVVPLSTAPLRSVQEPGRVQQRPGALRCGRPLVQSLPRHTPDVASSNESVGNG